MKLSEHGPPDVSQATYTQDDWDEVSDNPELTPEQLAGMRLGPEGLPPDLTAALAERPAPVKGETGGISIALRVAPDVLAAYKAAGPGWRARMNEALAKGAPHEPARAKAAKSG